MKLDDLKRSIDTLTPGKELQARILALPGRPSRPRRSPALLQAAVLGGVGLLCVGLVAAVMMLTMGGKPGIDVINPAASSTRNLAAGQPIGTASTAQVQAAPPQAMEPAASEEPRLVPTSPILSPGQDIGVDMAFLDYASDDIVIFHGYFGLFVYDLNGQRLLRSLDLKPIGCAATQGDHSCMVLVSADGNTVQLKAGGSKTMYVYTVSDNTLQVTDFHMMANRFDNFVETFDVIGIQKAGYRSFNAVPFGKGKYGYLSTSDWTVGTLTYVRGGKVYKLFRNLRSEPSAS